jgi:signal transduction histidine kinase
MEDLVNSFLVSAINDSIKHKLDFSNFDINELVLSVIKSFELAAVKKNQKMVYEILSFPVNITSDRLKIKEVIENLISNAIKYSEENKRISVVVKKNEDFIEIMVTDQGPGFSESDLKKIFGKFQRLSARPTGDESSSGLGLFITKTIVDNLKGSIDLESEPGKGSTFRVKLPFSNRPVFEVKKVDRQQLNREVPII